MSYNERQMLLDMDAQDIIREMRRPIRHSINREYFSTRLADIIDDPAHSCERCAGDGTIDYVCPWCMGNGCKICHGHGMIVEPCPECQEKI